MNDATIQFRGDRLLMLADHLDFGQLGHQTFDFRVVNDGPGGSVVDGVCGTLGCAIGELPILFPADWRFGTNVCPGYAHLRNDCYSAGDFDDAEVFFGISSADAWGLFCPNEYSPWNEHHLTASATRYDVAASIRRFVAWKSEKLGIVSPRIEVKAEAFANKLDAVFGTAAVTRGTARLNAALQSPVSTYFPDLIASEPDLVPPKFVESDAYRDQMDMLGE